MSFPRPIAPLLIATSLAMLPTDSWAQNRTGPFAPVHDVAKQPRVLLLGDSISIGYTIPVQRMLRGQANVHRAPTNCGPTSRGLSQLAKWLGDERWDVIHFNFGLHDLKYVDDKGGRVPPEKGRLQIPPDQYRQNLAQLVKQLQATGAKLIWCTTTPVPEGAHGRIVGDAKKYNAIAAEVIAEQGRGKVRTNDLYGFAVERLPQIQRNADVHFTPEGSRQLGIQVAEAIRQTLELPSATPPTVRGVVFEDLNGDGQYQSAEPGLRDVRVSNGREIVKTDQSGRYELPVSDDSTVFVIKPRGYRTPLNANQLPQFYYVHKPNGSPRSRYPGVAPTGALPASVDFPLYPQTEPEAFRALMFGDPQPRNQREIDYIAHDVIEELIGTDASFGVTLGDIVFDDLSLFESQARTIALLGIPWYNVIGNHDLNYDAKNDTLSDETFERVFGPAYYAFDYGPVHFLVVDDVEWYVDAGDGKGKYRGGLGQRQMDFIRKDLAEIPKQQLVVLMMHIPLTDVHDRHELYKLIQERPFCMSIAAHTHRHEHRLIGKEDGYLGAEPHHHVINVTVSGSWWSGAKDERNIPHTIMTDGAPNGYSILNFDGNEYKLEFRAAGRPKDYQISIHAPESVSGQDPAGAMVYANYFNGSERSRLRMKVGEKGPWLEMQKTLEADPYFKRIYDTEAAVIKQFQAQGKEPTFRQLSTARPSSHLWKLALPKGLPQGTQLIHVEATDEHGRVYHGKRVIRID